MTDRPSSNRENRVFTVLLLIGFPAGLLVAMAFNKSGSDGGTAWSIIFAGACLGVSLYRTVAEIVGRIF
jgi:hypothetical protein